MDILVDVGPGFAGFAATRFASRAVATQIAKRWPSYAKHSGVAASVGSFLAAWLLAHRWKPLEPYADAITVGAGIAAGQTVLQMWFPKLGWVVSDATPDLDDQGTAVQQIASSQTADQSFDDNFEILDDNHGSWTTYNDGGDPGRYTQPQANHRQRQQQAAQQAAQQSDDVGIDLDDEMFVDAGSLGS